MNDTPRTGYGVRLHFSINGDSTFLSIPSAKELYAKIGSALNATEQKPQVAEATDCDRCAKVREAIVLALSTESLKRSVVTREIADIFGLPHEGPNPEAKAFSDRLRARLDAKGYSR